MKKEYINEVSWGKILAFLRNTMGIYVGEEKKCRNFVEAVHWMACAGTQWRRLESGYGNWNSIFKRFDAWSKKGIWEQLMQFCIEDPDLEHVMLDATIVRAHACAAGYGEQSVQGLGRSRGGFTCKISALVEALGLPLKFIITPGQSSDVTQADALLADIRNTTVLADRGYDSDAVRMRLLQTNCIAVIPPRSNRINQYYYDKHIYRERHAIECFFSKIKHFRRVFSRYDKSARNYMAFLSFVGAIIWLR